MSLYTIAMLSVHTSPLDRPGRTKDAGGMNVYIRALAQALAQDDISIDIFTRRTNLHTPTILQIHPSIRVIQIQAGPHKAVPKDNLYLHIPEFTVEVDAFRRQEGKTYDLLHSHYWLSGMVGEQLAERWQVPHVTMFHTLGSLKKQAFPDAQESLLRLEMEEYLIKHTDRIVAATPEERCQLIHLCGASAERVSVVPCGVDFTLFQPYDKQRARKQLQLPPQQPVVLFAGRLDPFKGPDLLLQAGALMKEDALLLLVGGKLEDDQELENLRHLATELGIEERVRFVGARPQTELPIYYSAADVTVIPSYHESFGLAAVESLACGTPVIATATGGLCGIVRQGETGFLVARQAEFFAQRLDELLSNHALRQHMQQASRDSVQKYSWLRIINQIEAVYADLVRQPSLAVLS